MLLLQTVSYCLQSGWIVLYVPRGKQFSSPSDKLLRVIAATWIDSSVPYAYDPRSKTFHQQTIASTLLKSLTVNERKLAEIKLEKQVSIDGQTIAAGTSLVELFRLGRNEKLAVEVLAALMDVLGTQTQCVTWLCATKSIRSLITYRYPVLFALDEAQALFQQTTYRSPNYTILESYSLSGPLLALEYLSGRKSFVRHLI